MTLKVELVTPKKALEMLTTNSGNRRVRDPRVLRYAEDMKQGRWITNTAEPIKISKRGLLLDGQHRLEAIIKSNVSIEMLIAYDLEDSIFKVLDTGLARNASDTFKTAGIKHDNLLPSIISFYNAISEGKSRGSQVSNKKTNAELLEQYKLDDIFWQDAANLSMQWYNKFSKVLAPSYFGGVYAFLKDINPEKSYNFCEQIASGVGIENNAIILLRKRLVEDRISTSKLTISYKIALFIKAWNAFVSNNNIKCLRYNPSIENYPTANIK